MTTNLRSKFSKHFSALGDRIYLANHSLGRPLDDVHDNVARGLGVWETSMADAWNDDGWIGEITRFRSLISKLIDIDDLHRVVPKASAGQGLRAVLNSFPVDKPISVLTTSGEFDSIDFILKSYQQAGRIEKVTVAPSNHEGPCETFESNVICNLIDDSIHLVVVSAVYFRTGQVLSGLGQIIEAAHRVGARVVVDAYHAIGAVPFSMSKLGADYVIGGSYKYLRGGPGASFLCISSDISSTESTTLDTGWYAKNNTFDFEQNPGIHRKNGGDGWMESTPAVLPFYQSTPGIHLVNELGMTRIRAETLAILDHLRSALDDKGVPVFRPARPSDWGAFAVVPHDDPTECCRALKDRGIVVDARANLVRFGADNLTTAEEIDRTALACQEVWQRL